MGILSNMELSVEVCAGLLQSVPMGAAECVQGAVLTSSLAHQD